MRRSSLLLRPSAVAVGGLSPVECKKGGPAHTRRQRTLADLPCTRTVAASAICPACQEAACTCGGSDAGRNDAAGGAPNREPPKRTLEKAPAPWHKVAQRAAAELATGRPPKETSVWGAVFSRGVEAAVLWGCPPALTLAHVECARLCPVAGSGTERQPPNWQEPPARGRRPPSRLARGPRTPSGSRTARASRRPFEGP